MSSEIDVPNLPFKKPVEVEELEEMGYDQREAMDYQEMSERINSIAYILAESCQKQGFSSRTECSAIIHSALTELGASFSGRFGAKMVALSESAAKEACKEVFE